MAKTTTKKKSPPPPFRLVRGARMRPEDLEVVSIDVPPGEEHLYRRIDAADVRAGDVIEQPRATVRVADHGRVFEVDLKPARVTVTATGRDAWGGAGGERYARRCDWEDLATGVVTDCHSPHVDDPKSLFVHLGRFVARGPAPGCGGCPSCSCRG